MVELVLNNLYRQEIPRDFIKRCVDFMRKNVIRAFLGYKYWIALNLIELDLPDAVTSFAFGQLCSPLGLMLLLVLHKKLVFGFQKETKSDAFYVCSPTQKYEKQHKHEVSDF